MSKERLYDPPLMPHLLVEGLNRYNDEPCLFLGDKVASYREVRQTTSQMVQALQAKGLGKGSRVAVISANRPEVLSNIAAMQLTGCVGTPLHPLGSLVVGGAAGIIFVRMFEIMQNQWQMDDVLGVWPLHGICGAWGGIAAGIFGSKALGGAGGIAFMPQLIMTAMAIAVALIGGTLVYGVLKATMGLRLDQDEEYEGADLSIHRITATPEREPNW